jgi:hypothetical protein
VEGHAALAADHVLQIALGLDQLHLAQGKRGLTRVLEVNTQVRATSLWVLTSDVYREEEVGTRG